jgi:hypothetical protein
MELYNKMGAERSAETQIFPVHLEEEKIRGKIYCRFTSFLYFSEMFRTSNPDIAKHLHNKQFKKLFSHCLPGPANMSLIAPWKMFTNCLYFFNF